MMQAEWVKVGAASWLGHSPRLRNSKNNQTLIAVWFLPSKPEIGRTAHFRAHLPCLGVDDYIDLRAKTLEGAC